MVNPAIRNRTSGGGRNNYSNNIPNRNSGGRNSYSNSTPDFGFSNNTNSRNFGSGGASTQNPWANNSSSGGGYSNSGLNSSYGNAGYAGGDQSSYSQDQSSYGQNSFGQDQSYGQNRNSYGQNQSSYDQSYSAGYDQGPNLAQNQTGAQSDEILKELGKCFLNTFSSGNNPTEQVMGFIQGQGRGSNQSYGNGNQYNDSYQQPYNSPNFNYGAGYQQQGGNNANRSYGFKNYNNRGKTPVKKPYEKPQTNKPNQTSNKPSVQQRGGVNQRGGMKPRGGVTQRGGMMNQRGGMMNQRGGVTQRGGMMNQRMGGARGGMNQRNGGMMQRGMGIRRGVGMNQRNAVGVNKRGGGIVKKKLTQNGKAKRMGQNKRSSVKTIKQNKNLDENDQMVGRFLIKVFNNESEKNVLDKDYAFQFTRNFTFHRNTLKILTHELKLYLDKKYGSENTDEILKKKREILKKEKDVFLKSYKVEYKIEEKEKIDEKEKILDERIEILVGATYKEDVHKPVPDDFINDPALTEQDYKNQFQYKMIKLCYEKFNHRAVDKLTTTKDNEKRIKFHLHNGFIPLLIVESVKLKNKMKIPATLKKHLFEVKVDSNIYKNMISSNEAIYELVKKNNEIVDTKLGDFVKSDAGTSVVRDLADCILLFDKHINVVKYKLEKYTQDILLKEETKKSMFDDFVKQIYSECLDILVKDIKSSDKKFEDMPKDEVVEKPKTEVKVETKEEEVKK